MNPTKKRWLRFPAEVDQDFLNAVIQDNIDYTFKIASSQQELFQAFHLLYKEYRKAGYVTDKPRQILFNQYHLLPETTVFIAKKDGEVLSTASIVYDSTEAGLPMDCLYRHELDALRKRNRRILEISSLASEKSLTGIHVATNFTRLVFLYSIFQKVNDICIMVNPRHVEYYARYFPFTVFGEEKFYPKVNAPAVALRVDVDEVRAFFERTRMIYTLGHQVFRYYLSVKIAINYNIFESIASTCPPCMPSTLLDAASIHRMLSDEPEVLQGLPKRVRRHLMDCYPGLML